MATFLVVSFEGQRQRVLNITNSHLFNFSSANCGEFMQYYSIHYPPYLQPLQSTLSLSVNSSHMIVSPLRTTWLAHTPNVLWVWTWRPPQVQLTSPTTQQPGVSGQRPSPLVGTRAIEKMEVFGVVQLQMRIEIH